MLDLIFASRMHSQLAMPIVLSLLVTAALAQVAG
jgi:hypothetical protein